MFDLNLELHSHFLHYRELTGVFFRKHLLKTLFNRCRINAISIHQNVYKAREGVIPDVWLTRVPT
jgi:hypothetical protein